MAFTYEWREFLHHQKLWETHYKSLPDVPGPAGAGVIHLGDDKSFTAVSIRIRSMMIAEGAAPTDEGKKGKVFHLVQCFLSNHVDTFYKAGLVRLHDGKSAVVAPALALAMHQAIVGDPPPKLTSIPVESVIKAAKEKYFHWVHPTSQDQPNDA